MEWTDLLTLALVLVALWTFFPRRLRHAMRSGLEPAVIVLADTVRDVSRAGAKVLTVVAYRGLLGVPVPDKITVKSEEPSEEIEDVGAAAVTDDTATLFPIAAPNNKYSGELSDSEFETRAKVVAELYRSGAQTNLSKTICQVFRCSVQSAGKPESTYQRALREVNKHLPSGPQFRQDDGTTKPATRPVTGRRTHA